MKILIFSHQADFIYGGEVVTLSFLRALKRKGIDLEFASPAGKYHDRAKEIVPTHLVGSIQFSRKYSGIVSFLRAFFRTRSQLKKLIEAEKLTHIHATSLKAMVYVWRLSPKVKMFWHHHDILPESLSNRIWLRVLALGASLILVPSRATKEALHLAGIEEKKVAVLYNGFPLSDFIPRPPRDTSLPWKILFLGELSFRKGFDRMEELLRALKNSSFAKEQLQIDVVGAALSDPDWAEKTKARIQAEDTYGWVRFHGRQENVHSYLKSADFLFVPSRQDPLPTVIIEAALTGVPSLAFPIGGIPEMVGVDKSGFLVNSVDEAAARVLDVIENSTWQDESDRTLSFARKKFDIDILADQLIEHYGQGEKL